MDTSANARLIQLSTDSVDARHRAALIGDTMTRQLAGGDIAAHDGSPQCDWRLAMLDEGTVLGRCRQGGFSAARDAARLRDDDTDVTVFLGVDGVGRFEQQDRRVLVAPHQAVIVAHGLPVQSWWTDAELFVLRLPRNQLRNADRIERDAGRLVDRSSGALGLLEGYLGALWSVIEAGHQPSIAARHVAELVDAMFDELSGIATQNGRSGAAIKAARLTAIREAMRRRYADPGLDMALLAGELGLSERAGYLLFERETTSFSEELCAIRLDRAAERIRAGYAGRLIDLAFACGFNDASHFNRRFRARFGMTPSELRSLR